MNRLFVSFCCLSILLMVSGCPKKTAKNILSADRIAAAKQAVDTLQATKFEEAQKIAKQVLAEDPGNSQARVVHAICIYKKFMHNFIQADDDCRGKNDICQHKPRTMFL